MIAVALAMTWAGYAVGMYGYCLVRGYDVTFRMLFKPTWPGPAANGAAPAPAADPGAGTFNV